MSEAEEEAAHVAAHTALLEKLLQDINAQGTTAPVLGSVLCDLLGRWLAIHIQHGLTPLELASLLTMHANQAMVIAQNRVADQTQEIRH